MEITTSSINNFYNSNIGEIVCKETIKKLSEALIDQNLSKVCGLGYTSPYTKFFQELNHQSDIHEMVPDFLGGIIKFNSELKQEVVDEYALPVEPDTFDVIFLSHILELVENPEKIIEEAQRVLKPNGVLVSIVPRRSGLWTRYDNNPFGFGRSFSKKQISYLLDPYFYSERSYYYLFTPPWKHFINYKSSPFLEKIGPLTVPFLGGLKMEISKKIIYAKNLENKKKKQNIQRNFAPI
ncbi:MAG: hypothetical protein CMI90_00930 [Pelagibacteraceae bacterium]|nr:hypothetical protein [Pelagibacteraceae bacterium]|tara:strand:+ start:473 stop:1186 length:714 start_codon:yes stop_codon:yes gene_type:complete